MLTKLHKGESYASRPAESIPVPLSLDLETAVLLEQLAPGKRSRSRYVARLIHAEVARQAERQQVVAWLQQRDEEGHNKQVHAAAQQRRDQAQGPGPQTTNPPDQEA